MATRTRDNRWGVGVSYDVVYDGGTKQWGTLLSSVSSFSNKSEPTAGDFQISDFSANFVDTNGSMWGSLGNGTTAFNKDFAFIINIGGDYDYVTQSDGREVYQKTSDVGATKIKIHQGKVFEVSKSNNVVSIKSHTKMRQLSELKWHPPVHNTGVSIGTILGSYAFYEGNLKTELQYGSLAFNNYSDDGETWECTAVSFENSTNIFNTFGTIDDRSQIGSQSNYTYYGTDLYDEETYPRYKMKGSYLGTFIGSIRTNEQARKFGYSSVGEAEANVIKNSTGTKYALNKTRFSAKVGLPKDKKHFHFFQRLVLKEEPGELFKAIVTGHCVEPIFNFTNDIDSSYYDESKRLTTFHTLRREVEVNEESPLDVLKDLFVDLDSLFLATEDNKIGWIAYGPKDLQATIENVGTEDIVSSSYSNNVENAYNRFLLDYRYDLESDEFQRQVDVKGDNWNRESEILKHIKSKWITNDNEAKQLVIRLKRKFAKTSPRINITTSLEKTYWKIGTLISITDPNIGASNKRMQIIGYDIDFNSGLATWEGYDGEALFTKLGFGIWGSHTTPQTGDNNSKGIWGSLINDTQGTAFNINETLYGTHFVWW